MLEKRKNIPNIYIFMSASNKGKFLFLVIIYVEKEKGKKSIKGCTQNVTEINGCNHMRHKTHKVHRYNIFENKNVKQHEP